MDDTKERIEEIIRGLDLEKKPRVTKKEKEAYESLKSEVGGLKAQIDKLNIRLWHACYKGDYRSLPLDEAKDELRRARDRIDEILSD